MSVQSVCQGKGGRYFTGMIANLPPYTPQEYCEVNGRVLTAADLNKAGESIFPSQPYPSQRSQCEARGGVWAAFSSVEGGVLDADNHGVCQPRPGVPPYMGTRQEQCAAIGGQWSDPNAMFPEGICRGGREYPVPPPPVRPEPAPWVRDTMSAQEQRKHNAIAYAIRRRWIVSGKCTKTMPLAGTSAYRNCGFYRTYRVLGQLRPAAPAYDFDRMVAWVQARLRQLNPVSR